MKKVYSRGPASAAGSSTRKKFPYHFQTINNPPPPYRKNPQEARRAVYFLAKVFPIPFCKIKRPEAFLLAQPKIDLQRNSLLASRENVLQSKRPTASPVGRMTPPNRAARSNPIIAYLIETGAPCSEMIREGASDLSLLTLTNAGAIARPDDYHKSSYWKGVQNPQMWV